MKEYVGKQVYIIYSINGESRNIRGLCTYVSTSAMTLKSESGKALFLDLSKIQCLQICDSKKPDASKEELLEGSWSDYLGFKKN